METWKIIEIQSVNEFTNDYWTTYYFKMKMDNWEVISIWKKKKDAFKLGDTLTYEEYTNSKGKQAWREAKENNFKKSYNPEANNRWAMVWLAYKIAFDKAYNWEDDFNATIQLANRIFEEAMSTYSNTENKETDNTDQKKESPTQNKQAELEDLPF